MTIKTKKTLTLTLAWAAFLLMLGIVGGGEKGWMTLSAMWWCIPCLMVWAGGLYKAGWIKV